MSAGVASDGRALAVTGAPAASVSGQWSWAVFEWARNPYVILITIYLFAPYFTNHVVGDPVRGQAVWGAINGYGGIATALLAPILGAIADSGGRRKPWLAFFVCVMAPTSFGLWYALPGGAGLSVPWIAFILIANSAAFEYSAVFHNAMLPSIAPAARVGFLSGLGLALGNASSLLILVFMLWAFSLPGNVDWSFVPAHPLFGLDTSLHEQDRITGPIAAVWLLAFATPLFLFTPDRNRGSLGALEAIRAGFRQLAHTLRELRSYRNVAMYLFARMIYNDGKTAVLVFGGVYASGIFGWNSLTMTIFGIVLSVFAVFGGFVGGWLDDTFGSKRAILVSIGGTSLGLVLAVSITPDQLFFTVPWDRAAPHVWSLPFFATVPELVYIGVLTLVAVFITAAYANSRTMLARIVPPAMMTEFFGIYSLSGTSVAWIGSFTVRWFTEAFHSQRIGFASILIFLLGGLVLMTFVREERASA
ncbi:MAG TPA: MFS transporter [Myxococcota bacterium]|nr:MFS transporter [Myxococcota bacterium]